MNAPLEKMVLWQSAFSNADQDLKRQTEELKQSLYKFRERISQLVSAIGSEFPGLTVHDITHLDALWHVAEQVTGSDYALNPAEAYVLGGAFLLHDAAHTAIAYPGGLKEIKETLVWQDLVAQNLNHNEPSIGSSEEKEILFQVLRHLHAEHAKNLALMEWKTPDANDATYLIESLELRKHYGHLIGEIAASHHWSAHKVAEIFSDRNVPCAAHLSPAKWSVDALKIALILRTADAAHLDAGRAPWFLFALRNPGGVSRKHWQFQAKIGQPVRSKTGELTISSGAPFEEHERDAWWLAYDTAKMVDHELRSADALLQQFDRPRFAAKSVLGISSSEAFARQVRAQGWEPVDVKPTVGNVPRLIARLGGKALYGEDSSAALKELLQNSVDAIHALRALGGLEKNEGRIDIHLRDMNDYWQLDIADTGIGMSRHVLTNVLLDFGTSFWSSSMMLEELPGLAKSGFKSIGKFGIGFYSAFMLTDEITITSRRFEQSANDRANQWQLIFDSGVNGRPIIREARQKDQLKRQGTRITLKLNSKSLQEMLRVNFDAGEILIKEKHYKQIKTQFLRVVYSICPSADTEITLTIQDNPSETIIKPLDWIDLDNTALSKRISCDGVKLHPLYNAAGTLLARVGFSTSNIEKPGIVAIQGITAGTIHNISGIMTAAGNNNNAARTDAIPAGTKEDWKKWAELFLATEKVSAETLLKIHPLMPEQDLTVFMIGSKFVSLEQLIKEIEAFDEIMVYTEHISHDWDDDISSSNFDKHFEHAENIVGIPHHQSRSKTYFVANDAPFRPRHKIAEFPWFLDVEAINYEQLFEEKISERWDLISTSEPLTVGTALNTEIIRAVSVYSKKEQ